MRLGSRFLTGIPNEISQSLLPSKLLVSLYLFDTVFFFFISVWLHSTAWGDALRAFKVAPLLCLASVSCRFPS